MRNILWPHVNQEIPKALQRIEGGGNDRQPIMWVGTIVLGPQQPLQGNGQCGDQKGADVEHTLNTNIATHFALDLAATLSFDQVLLHLLPLEVHGLQDAVVA